VGEQVAPKWAADGRGSEAGGAAKLQSWSAEGGEGWVQVRGVAGR